jgi:putative ABC transport system permease protein
LLIFMTIIFLALSFGIINTMLMAVLDRVREIGMLMAIGMNKIRIFLMITIETILLMLTGSAIGLLLSYLLVEMFKIYGIDMTAFASGLGKMGFSSVVYPFIEPKAYIQIVVLVVITGLLSSIIPARKALKLNPSEAIRTQ